MKQREISPKEKDKINIRVIEATKQDLSHIKKLELN